MTTVSSVELYVKFWFSVSIPLVNSCVIFTGLLVYVTYLLNVSDTILCNCSKELKIEVNFSFFTPIDIMLSVGKSDVVIKNQ